MRSKKEILEGVNSLSRCITNENPILEVLVDIRDVLVSLKDQDDKGGDS